MKTPFSNLLKSMMALAIGILCSVTAFSQSDPGPNPDGPAPAVPMSDYMHLMLAAAGIVFALVVYRKKLQA